MDKIAVISDVHGNMHALEAVLADIHERGITLIYNLGDLIGKGARSDLAVDRCREACQQIVRGNWDDAIIDPPDERVQWYRQQLGAERLAYLATLPNVIDFWLSGKRVRLFHASEESVYKRIYSTEPPESYQPMFTNTPFTGFDEPEPTIVGYGDIHVAYLRTFFGSNKMLFNAGSVGNPLDMPLASYAVLTGVLGSHEPAPFTLDFVRVPYDIEQEIADARRVGVPDMDAYAVELRSSVYRGLQQPAAK